MSSRIRHSGIKISEWFGRPTEELKGWIERGRAIEEIKAAPGYQLILGTIEAEIDWAQQQLEICKEEMVTETRLYLRALRFVKNFIITTERNADISSSVLAGRPRQIAEDSFVRSATPQGADDGARRSS